MGTPVKASELSLRERKIADSVERRPGAADEIDAFIAATFDVIANSGSLDPQIREILDEAGLSRQVFYRHFASKDELLLVVLDESRQIVARYLNKRIARVDGASARLHAWIDGVLRQANDAEASRRTRPFVITGNRLQMQFPLEYEGSKRVLVDPLVALISEGVACGEFVSTDPYGDAQVIYDATFARQNRFIADATVPTRRDTDQIFNFALRALGAIQ